MIRRSRVRLGKTRFTGLPAACIGLATVVAAGGAAVALVRAAGTLPELIRESRELWLAVTGTRRRLEMPGDVRRGTQPHPANPLGR